MTDPAVPVEDLETDFAMDRNLALEVVRITEAAALAASRLMGGGDERAADAAAIAAVVKTLTSIDVAGRVVIGEGEAGGDAPLCSGENVGSGRGPKLDLALDSLEGSSIVARGGPDALSVIAMAERDAFFRPPRMYMEKIAVGGGLPSGVVTLAATPAENLASLAEARGVDVADLLVCILERPRHEALIAEVRASGARVMLIPDGDLSAVIATARDGGAVHPDIYMGIGGAQEGVLAAAALKCVGGQMEARLIFRSDSERNQALRLNIAEPDRIYGIPDMVKGEVMFAATGVTQGSLLQGVRRFAGGATTHSMVLRSKSGTVRFITAHHHFRHPGHGE